MDTVSQCETTVVPFVTCFDRGSCESEEYRFQALNLMLSQ